MGTIKVILFIAIRFFDRLTCPHEFTKRGGIVYKRLGVKVVDVRCKHCNKKSIEIFNEQ